jgi:hypothetical protein
MPEARDWFEDFKLENGNYCNLCSTCEQPFLGHKRRTVCRLCHNAEASALIERIEALYYKEPKEKGISFGLLDDVLKFLRKCE